MKKILMLFVLAFMLVCIGSCGEEETEKAMTYAEYKQAELDSEVIIEAWVQGKQSWWNNQATVYLQDQDGAYFVYNMTCSEEDYALIPTGTKIRVKGVKTEWGGEIEIASGSTFEILNEEPWTATAKDVTSYLGTDSMINYQNQFVAFKNLTIVSSQYVEKDEGGNIIKEEDRPFLYKNNKYGDDIYFKVSDGKNTYDFTVESYLCDKNSQVYQDIESLNIGDTVNLEGFAYWYNGLNPHITSCKLVK